MAEELIVVDAPVTVYSDPELASISDQSSSALAELLPETPIAREFEVDFRDGCNQLHAAGVKDLANPETGNKYSADAFRDRKYLGFRYKAEGQIFNEDEAIAANASKILDVIHRRGYSMQKFGLKKQTSAMDGLIIDLDIPQLRAAMDQTGVTAEFDSMVQAQKAYKLAEDNHTRAATEITNPSLVAARKLVRNCIVECNAWLSNRLRKEPEVFTPMVLRWNEIISTITAQAHARETRKENVQTEKAEINQPAVSQV